jgi:hypothetical protein
VCGAGGWRAGRETHLAGDDTHPYDEAEYGVDYSDGRHGGGGARGDPNDHLDLFAERARRQ